VSKSKSPFKANSALRKQIEGFLATHGATLAQEAKRTSMFFELAAYNDVVQYYETNGYAVKPENLRGTTSDFVYALSPNAKAAKCSYFSATKNYNKGVAHEFEIRHNLRVRSAHDTEIFVAPDYVVIDKEALQSTRFPHYYNGKVDYVFVAAEQVRTFAETKHYMPSPELVLNFVGIVNEIKPAFIRGEFPEKRPKHCGPSLIISGVGNVHLRKIKDSLADRYRINVFLGLFQYPSQLYSKGNQANIKKIGTE